MLQLKKFPDIPVSTRVEAREFRPHPEEQRFRLLAREQGSFPCVVGKEFPAFLSHSRGGALHRKGERNSRVVPPFPESPRCLSPFQENCFPYTASTFKPRIDSHHGGTWDSPEGKPRGKASWESLVGKPRGKAPDPLIHAKGSVTLLLRSGGKRTCIPPLETTTDSPGETPEVPQDPSQHLRGMLRFRHLLHTRS